MVAKEKPTSDESGELIARFANTMHNLGMARAADELVKMMESGRWRKFVQGFQTFEFLPGEFDYFLTQQEVTREMVMAIPDVEAKARLEEAMDERKTGEPGYRRPILQVRSEVPRIPGRIIMPFGYGEKEAKALVGDVETDGCVPPVKRHALGRQVRRWRLTGGETTKAPAEERPKWERLVASAVRLENADLDALYEAVRAERQKRRRKSS